MASLDDFDDDNEQVTAELGDLGLTAAGFDYFNFDKPIEFCIGKIGSHVKFKSSEIVKLLCCQVLNVPYQSLYGTQEFYRNRPLQALINRKDITFEQLDRNVLSRTLDAIAEFGPENLFLRCSAKVAEKLGLKVESVHLDSTSFHYSGEPRIEDGCNIVLDQGYSRDNHPELGQINELMLCDELSKRLYLKPVSVDMYPIRPVSEMSLLTIGTVSRLSLRIYVILQETVPYAPLLLPKLLKNMALKW